MQFAKWVFRIAGIYGVLLMTPMFFLEPVFIAQGQPLTHPENYYGFVGVTLAFQFVFLTMSRDVARFRPLIPVCLFEKLVFPAFVWPLYLAGRTPAIVAFFASVDLMWAVLFTLSWMRTKPSAT